MFGATKRAVSAPIMNRAGSWYISSGDLGAVTKARRSFGVCLRAIATASSDLMGCEMIFGELAANGLEHGKGGVTLTLWQKGASLLLCASDEGGWSPAHVHAPMPEPLAERGRGMFFVDSFGRRIIDPEDATEIRVLLPAMVATQPW